MELTALVGTVAIILLFCGGILNEWRRQFLLPINTYRIIDHFGGEIKVNDNSKLIILKSANLFEGNTPDNVDFIFICNDVVLEEVTCNLTKINRHQDNISFSKPWKKDIENALVASLSLMKKEIKERKYKTKECKKKFYNENK